MNFDIATIQQWKNQCENIGYPIQYQIDLLEDWIELYKYKRLTEQAETLGECPPGLLG